MNECTSKNLLVKLLYALSVLVVACGPSTAFANDPFKIIAHTPLVTDAPKGAKVRLGIDVEAVDGLRFMWVDSTGRVLCRKKFCKVSTRSRSPGPNDILGVAYTADVAFILKFNVNVSETVAGGQSEIRPTLIPYEAGRGVFKPLNGLQAVALSGNQEVVADEQSLTQIESGTDEKVFLLPASKVKALKLSSNATSYSLRDGSVRGVIRADGQPIYITVEDWLIVRMAGASDVFVTRGINGHVTVNALRGSPQVFFSRGGDWQSTTLQSGTQALVQRGRRPNVYSDPLLLETVPQSMQSDATPTGGDQSLAELKSILSGGSPLQLAAVKEDDETGQSSSAAQIVTMVADNLLDDSISLRTGLFNFKQTGVISEQGETDSDVNGSIGPTNLSVDWNRHFAYKFSRTMLIRYVYDPELERLRYFAGGIGLRYYPRGGHPEGLAQLKNYDGEYSMFRPYIDTSLMLGQFLIGSAFGNIAVFSSDFVGLSLTAGAHIHIFKTFSLDISAGYEQDRGIGAIEFGSVNQYFSIGLLNYH